VTHRKVARLVQSPELKRQRKRPIAGGEEKDSMKEGCEYGHKKKKASVSGNFRI